jgi:hypothetical protein
MSHYIVNVLFSNIFFSKLYIKLLFAPQREHDPCELESNSGQMCIAKWLIFVGRVICKNSVRHNSIFLVLLHMVKLCFK